MQYLHKGKAWVEGLPRNLQYALAGSLIFLILASSAFSLFSGGGEAEPEVPPEPMLLQSDLRRFVEATIEAYIPTPIPTPTPDVPATVAAELGMRRVESDRVVEVNPLGAGVQKNPFLTQAEMEHLNGLGPSVWRNVRLWVILRDLSRSSIEVWDREDLPTLTASLQEYVEDDDNLRLDRLSDRVGGTVAAFTAEYESSVSELTRAASAVVRMQGIVAGAEQGVLTTGEEDELLELKGTLNRGVRAFHQFMSGYGCSVCGELFRTTEP